ncbi:hypothetical protein V8Z74_14650 [Comamonas sp. w2-DMI]|uniref:hypothetical protein n=1 Tax=Comamonas sp. w2-DMI TaxID=3126391 RepID=UPI0032E45E12
MTSTVNGNVFLSFGPQSAQALSNECLRLGNQAVYCSNTARMAGARVAAGTPEALARLRQLLAPHALEVQKRSTPELSDHANSWLSRGERGPAADSIFQHLTGIQVLKGSWAKGFPYHPVSTDDLRQCLELLNEVPELQAKFHLHMPSASTQWAQLCQKWSTLAKLMEDKKTMAARIAILEIIQG